MQGFAKHESRKWHVELSMNMEILRHMRRWETSRLGNSGNWQRAVEGKFIIAKALELICANTKRLKRALLFIHFMDGVLDFNVGEPTVEFCRKFDLFQAPCSKAMWEAETSATWKVEYKRYLSSRKGTKIVRFGDLRVLSQLDARDLEKGLVADFSNWADGVDSFGSMILSLCH